MSEIDTTDASLNSDLVLQSVRDDDHVFVSGRHSVDFDTDDSNEACTEPVDESCSVRSTVEVSGLPIDVVARVPDGR